MKHKHKFLLFFFFITLWVKGQLKTIDEENFVPIGGIGQWMTIKGNDTSKPVILFFMAVPGAR